VANADKSVKIVRPYPSNKTVSVSSSATFSCHIRTRDSTLQQPNVQVYTTVTTASILSIHVTMSIGQVYVHHKTK